MHRYSLTERLLFSPARLNRQKLRCAVNGKTVLITGATFGIGEAIALELGNSGAHLILTGRTAEKLEALQHLIRQSGGSAEIFPCDLRDPASLQRLIVFVQERGIDVFISNAGKSIRRAVFDSLDRYHDVTRTLALNYAAPVQLSLALIPLLEQRRGQLVNVSAVNVLMAPAPLWSAYQASKAAFDQWFRSVAPELRSRGIAATSVYLPLVRTRMIAPTEHYAKFPAMQPEHVAQIICKTLYTRRYNVKPWWAIFGEIGSVLFRKSWERHATKRLQP